MYQWRLFFFEREREKSHNSCSKNKEWAHKAVNLTISTFKLPLNKKALMRQIYFNPLAEEVAKSSLSHGTNGIKKAEVPFGRYKSKPSPAKTWDYPPCQRNWVIQVTRAQSPVKGMLNLVLTINPRLPHKLSILLTRKVVWAVGLYVSNLKWQWQPGIHPKIIFIVRWPGIIYTTPLLLCVRC